MAHTKSNETGLASCQTRFLVDQAFKHNI